MTVTLENIRASIYAVLLSKRMMLQYDSKKEKCNDFDKAKTNYQSAKRNYEKFMKILIEEINEYIGYPKSKFEIRQKKAYCKKILGTKVIYIPQIDKQEYYCLTLVLDECEYVHPYFKNSYYIAEKW